MLNWSRSKPLKLNVLRQCVSCVSPYIYVTDATGANRVPDSLPDSTSYPAKAGITWMQSRDDVRDFSW